MKSDSPQPDALPARVQRLEESQGFAERAIEQLSAEVAELSRRLAEARSHIARLESFLKAQAKPPPEVDSDPSNSPLPSDPDDA